MTQITHRDDGDHTAYQLFSRVTEENVREVLKKISPSARELVLRMPYLFLRTLDVALMLQERESYDDLLSQIEVVLATAGIAEAPYDAVYSSPIEGDFGWGGTQLRDYRKFCSKMRQVISEELGSEVEHPKPKLTVV